MSALAAETRRSILTRLELAVPAAIFQTWCRNLVIEEVGENAFEVPVPNAFYRDWLEREIRRPLEEAFRLEFGRAPELAFWLVTGWQVDDPRPQPEWIELAKGGVLRLGGEPRPGGMRIVALYDARTLRRIRR